MRASGSRVQIPKRPELVDGWRRCLVDAAHETHLPARLLAHLIGCHPGVQRGDFEFIRLGLSM